MASTITIHVFQREPDGEQIMLSLDRELLVGGYRYVGTYQTPNMPQSLVQKALQKNRVTWVSRSQLPEGSLVQESVDQRQNETKIKNETSADDLLKKYEQAVDEDLRAHNVLQEAIERAIGAKILYHLSAIEYERERRASESVLKRHWKSIDVLRFKLRGKSRLAYSVTDVRWWERL